MSEPANEIHPPPPAAQEVLLRGHDMPVGYACPTCGLLSLLTPADQGDERAKKEVADRMRLHCYRFCDCGAPVKTHRLRCDACDDKIAAAKKAERFQRADKVSIDDYPDQPVFWDSRGYHGGYFESIDEVLDFCEDNDNATPPFVWAALPTDFHIDADDIIESALERQAHYEGAASLISEEARKNLQAYLNVWSGELKIRTWHIDHRRAVLLVPDNDSTSSRNVG